MKVKCMEDQDEKLKKFSKASKVLALQLEKVKENETWSPWETEETSTLRSVTFTVSGGECLIMKDTLSIFKDLGNLDWEELPI